MLVSGSQTPSCASLRILKDAARAPDAAALRPHIRHHFQALLSDRGDWNLSIYDLAWVLCCDFFNEEDKRKNLALLLDAQHADGGWGDPSYMPHSALVDTLAATMALVRVGQPLPRHRELEARVEALIIACHDYPHHDTVAFELVAPKLLKWLERNQCTFPLSARSREFIETLDRKGDMKLGKLRQLGPLFDPGSTLSYTAELAALTPGLVDDVGQLPRTMLPNGAIGLSPSATAATILLLTEQGREVPSGLYQYLRDTFEDYQRTGFPNLHPIVTSRRLWNVRPWLVSGNIFDLVRDETILPLLTRIYQETNIDELGRVSWDTNNADLPDLDDTAVAFALYSVLVKAGVRDLKPMTSASLQRFQRKNGTFFCYPYELHPSPSALLHSVMSMDLAAGTFEEAFTSQPVNQEILRSLLEQLDPQDFDFDQLNHDKWHATWTYGVQKWLSLRSILFTYPERVRQMLTEVENRTKQGGWGQQEPTLEETAYVASGLATLLKYEPELLPNETEKVRELIRGSLRFLVQELQRPQVELPALWISKNMYAPRFQVASAVLDAMYGAMTLR
ncbi:hypothetical protein [Archangium lipolyticum]|uniref:hypothetical protein n=1 Tax=Archangium lipolyticum TaxID=2970465 RepID=UPI002149D72F|nr:hypothetical protein [Archangium lipolyticum]